MTRGGHALGAGRQGDAAARTTTTARSTTATSAGSPAIDPRAQTLEVDHGRPAAELLPADELDQLAVAYAVTVHKAQGSEYPAVVVPLLRQHGRMLRRKLLYTAITRARRLVVLLTEPDALERAVRSTGDLRRTPCSANASIRRQEP